MTLIASLVFPGDEDSSFYSICGNRFVLLQDNVVKIWDFVTNHWAAWTVEGEFYQVFSAPIFCPITLNIYYTQSIVDRNFVFLLHAGGVSMWRIPRLQSSSPPFNVVDPTPVISTVDLQYRRRTPTDDDQYAGPCDWYSGTGLPLVYDVVVPTDSTNAKLYRCEVQTTSDLQWSGLDEYAPLKITSTHEAPNNMDPYRFCLDTLVARWFDRSMGAARLFTAESRPLDTGPPIPVHTAVLTSTRAVSSFCPASGRFVYIEIDDVEAATPDTDSALEGFVVLDFLFVSAFRCFPGRSVCSTALVFIFIVVAGNTIRSGVTAGSDSEGAERESPVYVPERGVDRCFHGDEYRRTAELYTILKVRCSELSVQKQDIP